MDNLNAWMIPIESLMIWRAGLWCKYGTRSKSSELRVHYDQLLILSENSVLESFIINNRVKGIYKEDVLVLIAAEKDQEIRKVKFKVQDNAEYHLKRLSQYFPITEYKTKKNLNEFPLRFSTLEEILTRTINDKEGFSSMKLPKSYEKFVRICLFDPTFIQVVNETEKILNNMKKH